MKIHFPDLHAPLCMIFASNSVNAARYASLIWHKFPTNCDVHLKESIFQTLSRGLIFQAFFVTISCPAVIKTTQGLFRSSSKAPGPSL
ncbi:hypothetical protein D3Z60_02805 [Lachnospiraceae bacterium]|nr:hypothetical protein [Lachnospiraceae bacterium]